MKKILLFTVLSLVLFVSNGCSSGGEDNRTIQRITMVVDGLTKIFYNVTVNQSDPEFLIVRGQLGSEVIEAIDLEIRKNTTGVSAITSMIFTQNNIEYYAFAGSGVSSNVTSNGSDRVIKGNFQGNFRTLSGASKFISNGSFTINY